MSVSDTEEALTDTIPTAETLLIAYQQLIRAIERANEYNEFALRLSSSLALRNNGWRPIDPEIHQTRANKYTDQDDHEVLSLYTSAGRFNVVGIPPETHADSWVSWRDMAIPPPAITLHSITFDFDDDTDSQRPARRRRLTFSPSNSDDDTDNDMSTQ